MIVWMSAFLRGPVCAPSRCALVVVLAFVLVCVLLCASAGAQTVGYLYTAAGSQIESFDVGSDTSLMLSGSVASGTTSPKEPGALVMAKSADGENLYELAGGLGGATIRQYSIDPATGVPSPKSPEIAGSVPRLPEEVPHLMAVFNPAANGEAGQNAVYVLAGTAKQAELFVFDIDATTGAVTSTRQFPVPGILNPGYLAYSGNTLVVSNAGSVFQSAEIDLASATPVFREKSSKVCEYFCTRIYMIDPDEMLAGAGVIDTDSPIAGTVVSGVSAFSPGIWTGLGGGFTYRPGPAALTANAHEYFGLEEVPFREPLEPAEYWTRGEWGDVYVQTFAPDGTPGAAILMPEQSSALQGPSALFSLGSGLYLANSSVKGDFATGEAVRLSPPVQTKLEEPLGDAMTGFLLAGSAGPGPGGPGSGSSETPAAGSGTTPSAGSGSSGTPAGGAQIKGAGAVVKTLGLSGSGSAKLGSGVIKLDVTCGLPCTVSGFVLPPGAKAASAHKKPKALPFKSIRLAGTGKPVVVTLRFTPAQKQLAAALLRKHEKVTAKITVTEGPGGAVPKSKSIRIT
jgi:hypothetical protein